MMNWLFLIMPASVVMVTAALDLAGIAVSWGDAALGISDGLLFGLPAILGLGLGAGTALGVALGFMSGIGHAFFGSSWGPSFGLPGGFAYGILAGLVLDVALGVAIGSNRRGAKAIAGTFINSVVLGLVSGAFWGEAVGISFGVGSLLAYFRLPLYPLEATITTLLRFVARLRPTLIVHLASFLPYRHNDLAYIQHPFLAGFLIHLGEEDQAKGLSAIVEAIASVGQENPGRQAFVELQARSLERAARERWYSRTADLDLPFLSRRQTFRPKERHVGDRFQVGYLAIDSIAEAARDLEAARSTGGLRQRRQALQRARQELEQSLDDLSGARRLSLNERRFVPVVKVWLDRVADEEAALASLERERPQVPLVFVAGAPLTPADESLFVGREDLVRILDQDLAVERPIPLVLQGQRRMGKSTLLNFLPRMLGTGTCVVNLNFQQLSGQALKGEPHRWVLSEVATALARERILPASVPPQGALWVAALDWLATQEEPLSRTGRRLLITLDEVETLERGIQERWSDPAFLDFLRAAGDRLRRVRFLLVTAHPFSRLGPHWSSRLISAQTRRIELLGEDEARKLLTKPVPGFPHIYPPRGVERLLAETACHPYLLQLTAYQLTWRLNNAGRMKATPDDLTAALDQVLEENQCFQDLWNGFTTAEQTFMAALAHGRKLPAGADLLQVRGDLAREQYIRSEENGRWRVTVPLFARWIREIGAPTT
jgi:hypothetical protein